jgi:hypothetical protein
MSSVPENHKTTVRALAEECRNALIPLTSRFSYFCAMPVAEEDLKQYLNEPVAALSPAICDIVDKAAFLLTPYLEKNGRGGDHVLFEAPAEGKRLDHSELDLNGLAIVAFGINDLEMADYHYHFFGAVAGLVAGRWPQDVQDRYFRQLREELSADVHGEVDEKSWHLKQSLVRRQTNARKETKLFREYARQSFEDTLTLYLHGTCCDIDVETGPRQMPSRYLRRRIELLLALFPAPEGYAVLPENLNGR